VVEETPAGRQKRFAGDRRRAIDACSGQRPVKKSKAGAGAA
jgi:hypothetical protein